MGVLEGVGFPVALDAWAFRRVGPIGCFGWMGAQEGPKFQFRRDLVLGSGGSACRRDWFFNCFGRIGVQAGLDAQLFWMDGVEFSIAVDWAPDMIESLEV